MAALRAVRQRRSRASVTGSIRVGSIPADDSPRLRGSVGLDRPPAEGSPATLKSPPPGAEKRTMKMEFEFDDADPAQVANGLVRMLALALQTGVGVEVSDGSYSVTNPGDEQCIKRWIGPEGEFRREVMERRWVVTETTDAAGQRLPAPTS